METGRVSSSKPIVAQPLAAAASAKQPILQTSQRAHVPSANYSKDAKAGAAALAVLLGGSGAVYYASRVIKNYLYPPEPTAYEKMLSIAKVPFSLLGSLFSGYPGSSVGGIIILGGIAYLAKKNEWCHRKDGSAASVADLGAGAAPEAAGDEPDAGLSSTPQGHDERPRIERDGDEKHSHDNKTKDRSTGAEDLSVNPQAVEAGSNTQQGTEDLSVNPQAVEAGSKTQQGTEDLSVNPQAVEAGSKTQQQAVEAGSNTQQQAPEDEKIAKTSSTRRKKQDHAGNKAEKTSQNVHKTHKERKE